MHNGICFSLPLVNFLPLFIEQKRRERERKKERVIEKIKKKKKKKQNPVLSRKPATSETVHNADDPILQTIYNTEHEKNKTKSNQEHSIPFASFVDRDVYAPSNFKKTRNNQFPGRFNR